VSEAEGALFGDRKKNRVLAGTIHRARVFALRMRLYPQDSRRVVPRSLQSHQMALGTGAVLVKTAFKMSGHLKIEDKSQECSSLAFGGSARRGGPSRTRQRAKVWAATSSAVSDAIMLQTSCLCDSDKLQRGWARPADRVLAIPPHRRLSHSGESPPPIRRFYPGLGPSPGGAPATGSFLAKSSIGRTVRTVLEVAIGSALTHVCQFGALEAH
jgi:hypothetical protein